jgi:exodeoxyribonuclease VII small subunit
MAPRKDPPPASASESMSFEAALERLQTIVGELESGSLSLEDSIARYEEGMKLSRRLTEELERAEKRIERLVDSGNGGSPTTRPLDLANGPRDTDDSAEGELPF